MSDGQRVRIPRHPAYGRLGGKEGTIVGPVRNALMGRTATVSIGDAEICVWVDECWQCSWLTGTRWATEMGSDGHAYCLECGPESGQLLRALTPATNRKGSA